MRIKSIIVGIFFGLFIILGLLIYKDYGISWDDPIQRQYGIDTYNYVFEKNERLFKNKDRFYGPAVEFFHISVERGLDLSDGKDIYEVRHLVNFSIFLLGVFSLFLIVSKRFQSPWLGLLASIMLLASPRIFAHSFYNSKDTTFMAIFLIAVFLSLQFLERKTLSLAILAALSSAILIDVRIMGIILPFFVLDTFFYGKVKNSQKINLFIYFALTFLFVYVFWPTLWRSPLENFQKAFEQMRSYPQKTSTLTFGTSVKSTNIPWHYIFSWIGVTTPISYLVFFLSGVFCLLMGSKKIEREDIFMVGWFVIPIISVVFLKSNLYDGWRQLFFIYPPILYFAIYFLKNFKYKKLAYALLFVNLVVVLRFMVLNHPFQNIYFNELVSPPYEKKFSLDYWGLSYKQALEYIANIDKREKIRISSENFPGESNLLMLEPLERGRFEFVKDPSFADYYLTNYRKNLNSYYEKAFYEVRVSGTRIMGVHTKN